MEQYTLNDLERLTGVRADTIRIWERRHGIICPQRTSTNRRWYTGNDLRRLINISIMNRSGVKISEIASLAPHVLEEKTASLIKGSTGKDILTDSLVIAMTKYDETAVNEILLRSVIKNGFTGTFSSLVFPFLHKVGVMWHTGSVNAGAEHFISNIFRRKLISAFDNLSPLLTQKSKRILMFLPENEYHELGLLYYAYTARNLGHEVLYLGQSTPINAVIEVSAAWNPEIVITGALSGMSVKDHNEFVEKLSNSLSGKKILLAGSLAETAKKKKASTIIACRSEDELRLLLK
jgi:DNA-binding transcriptional MerR regulator/methylmalonyl-CoA mutase cobalamin-binding subunit